MLVRPRVQFAYLRKLRPDGGGLCDNVRLTIHERGKMRRRVSSAVAFAFLILTVACGGDASGPAPSFENISGSYTGAMGGISQGIALDADFSLTLAQNAGSINGTYALQGELTDGIDVVGVQGTGAIAGTIASGNNPSVNLTVTPAGCPNRSTTFSGTYDVPNRRLTLIGPVDFFDNNCNTVLRYQMNMVLTR